MNDFVGSVASKTSSADAKVGQEYTRTAPAHKTGISGIRSEEVDSTLDKLLNGLEKGLDLARKSFVRYVQQKRQGDDDAFYKVVQQTFEEIIKEEAKDAVSKVPFGKAILKTIELSEAFAIGVGEALDEVNKELEQKYDFNRLSPDEVTERDFELMQQMRRHPAQATEKLSGILRQGLLKVAEKLIRDLFKTAVDKLQEVIRKLAGQIATNLTKQHELMAIFNEAVSGAAGKIPDGRERVERLAFHSVSSAFFGQLGNEALAQRLKPILDATKSKEPIDVALLSAVIEIIMHRSYESYARRVPVEQGWDDLRQLLIGQAYTLLLRSKKSGILIEAGPTLEVKEVQPDNRLIMTIPGGLLAEIERPREGPTETERQRFEYREREYYALRDKLRITIQAKELQYQRRINKTPEEDRRETSMRLQNKLVTERIEGLNQLGEVRKLIIREFGEYFDGYHLETYLTLGESIPVPNLKDVK